MVRAICMFLRGNMPVVEMHMEGFGVGTLRYKARGHQPQAILYLGAAQSYVGDYDLDFAGDGGSLKIFGRDMGTCPEAELHGAAVQVTCEEI